MHKETILVTGGAGFIGSAFVGLAVAQGHKVVVLDALTYAGHRENLNWVGQKPGSWELVVGDIRDGALVSRLLEQHQVTWIADFAAESHVDNSIEKPGEFIETNIIGTYTMLEAVRRYFAALQGAEKERFRYLHVSTDEVYGSLGETGKFPKGITVTEVVKVDRGVGRLFEIELIAKANVCDVKSVSIYLASGQVVQSGPFELREGEFRIIELGSRGENVVRVEITATTNSIFGPQAKIQLVGR